MSNRLEPDETDFAGVAIYAGSRQLGTISDRGEVAEARLEDGTALGAFPNRRAATDAILMACRGGAP